MGDFLGEETLGLAVESSGGWAFGAEARQAPIYVGTRQPCVSVAGRGFRGAVVEYVLGRAGGPVCAPGGGRFPSLAVEDPEGLRGDRGSGAETPDWVGGGRSSPSG